MSTGLSDVDREMIDFAGRWSHTAAGQLAFIAARWGLSLTAYAVRLNTLINQPEALAYAPVTVARLRRLRDARNANRVTSIGP